MKLLEIIEGVSILMLGLMLLAGIFHFSGYDALGAMIYSIPEWAMETVYIPIFKFLESLAESWHDR
ncbi:MAG: hypothetical protein DDT21_02692 [Syntrophomonadaceae bacterium]|nr:hypothetical protein [Bacillota bacterium]